MSRTRGVYSSQRDNSDQPEVEPEVYPRKRIMPIYPQPFYVPAPRRRHGWIRYVVLAVIGLVLLSAGIAGYGKISQFFQLFQPNQSATVTVAVPQITVGQIHLQNTVIYATQDFSVK